MLIVREDHVCSVCAHWRAEFFASNHARLDRASATAPCIAVATSVRAWPFQKEASHRCGLHTLQIISRLNCWKHVPAIASRPIVANPMNEPQTSAKANVDTFRKLTGSWTSLRDNSNSWNQRRVRHWHIFRRTRRQSPSEEAASSVNQEEKGVSMMRQGFFSVGVRVRLVAHSTPTTQSDKTTPPALALAATQLQNRQLAHHTR